MVCVKRLFGFKQSQGSLNVSPKSRYTQTHTLTLQCPYSSTHRRAPVGCCRSLWLSRPAEREREGEWVSETERGTWRAQIEVRWLINCLPCFLLLRQTPCLVFLSPASSSLPFPPLSANGQLCQRRCHLQHPLRNTPNQLPTQKKHTQQVLLVSLSSCQSGRFIYTKRISWPESFESISVERHGYESGTIRPHWVKWWWVASV